MEPKKSEIIKILFVLIWSIAAFFIILAPVSERIFYRLAFRNINIPVFYWIWVFVGMAFISKGLYKYNPRNALRTIIPVSICFHLLVLMYASLTNSVVYTMDKRYLLYVLSIIYITTLLALLWVRSSFLGVKENTFLKFPLFFAPLLCFSYSLYKGNKAGIVILILAGATYFCIRVFKGFSARAGVFIKDIFEFFKKNEKALILVIFFIAFLLRILFSVILIHKTGDDYILASDDGDSYDMISWSIAEAPSQIFKILVVQQWPPVYFVFLGAIYKLFGRSFYMVILFQSLLGASLIPLVYLIGKRFFGRDTGLIASILVALSQPLIFVSAVLGTEAIYVPFIVFAIFLFLDALFYGKEKVFIKLALSGSIFGLAAMTLSSITLFPPLAFLFILVVRKAGVHFAKRLKMASVFFVTFLAVYLLIKSIYVVETGTFKNEFEESGHYLWTLPTIGYSYEIDPDNRKFIALGIDPFARLEDSLRIIAKEWKEVLKISLEVYPVRLENFLTWGNFGSFDPVFLTNPTRLPTRFTANLEFYTVFFFFLGLLLSFRIKETGTVYFLILFMAYYIAAFILLCVAHTLRYSCPIKPFLIILLAYGIYSGYKYFSNSKSPA